VALALIGFLVAVTARGLRERIGREAVATIDTPADRPRAPAHLAAADAAVRAGNLRDAVRELFLFTLVSLEERGALRHDPALTDREVLARAAGLPRAADLAALVNAYERVWYGVREPNADEVTRARELARRIAA
jgi:uncharacterized protein DUF4129